jgi:hypothetical protein
LTKCCSQARAPRAAVWGRSGLHAAACNHAAVSNALTIIGMFMPKFGLKPLLGAATLTAGFVAGTAPLAVALLLWAVSVARSHDPFSWERATEKNKNT